MVTVPYTKKSTMTEITNSSGKSLFMRDFLSSVVVFLVALPLCMGIAIACNLPPALGIVSGIVGGIIVGSLAGSPLQVTGPAAGLVVIVCDLIKEHGLEKVFFIIALAGVIQFIAGSLKLAQWFRAVPPSVVNGMLSGIGVLIFASQFHVMVDDAPKGSGINNLISIPFAVWKGLVPSSDATAAHHIAAPIGVLTIAIILFWEKLAPKRLKSIPASLLAITTATVVATLMHLPVKHVSLPGDLTENLSFMQSFDMSWLTQKELILDALGMALVATAETLLTATAIDKMHKGARTNYDKELCAQGIGNFICGFLGALPVTGVLVRSGVNVRSGAQSRLSTIIHGFWLLLFVSVLPFVIRLIPQCSLAALLVYTGFKLADIKGWKQIKIFGNSELAIYALTVISIVCIDLLTGVLIGVAASIAKMLYIFSQLDIQVEDDANSLRTDIYLKGAGTFLSLPKIAAALESVSPEREIKVHLEDLEYADHACIDLFMNWNKQSLALGRKVIIDWSALGQAFKDSQLNKRDVKTSEFKKVLSSAGKA